MTIVNFTDPLLSQEAGLLTPDPVMRMQNAEIWDSTLTFMWPLLLIGVGSRVLTLICLYIVDRPQQNKTAFTKLLWDNLCGRCCRPHQNKTAKLVWNNVCGRCCCHSVKSPNMVALTSDDENTQTSVHVSNPLDEDTNSTEAADRIRKITRDSFASIEHFDSDNTTTVSGTDTDILKARKIRRASRKSQLLSSTRIVGGMKERTLEEWGKRLAAHGESSQKRIYQRKKQMALLFDLWDEAGNGFIDPDDMKSISERYQKKIHVAFGDPLAWNRVRNIGVFSHQNFNQFFDWFVVQPTVDAISSSVMKGNPKKAHQIQLRSQTRNGESKLNSDERRRSNRSFNTGRMRRLRLMKNKWK